VSRPNPTTEVAAGVGAALAFLAMLFLLHMPLGLGVLLAACVYAGIALLGRSAAPARVEPTEQELLQQIHESARSIANARVRQKIGALLGQAQRVLVFLEEHPERADAWRAVVRECLQSSLRIVNRYADLSRFFEDPSRQSLREVEELLDQVSATFTNVGQRLIEEGAADLTAEMEVFRSTLQAVNEVNVLKQGGSNS
jgi:hypothetical protein